MTRDVATVNVRRFSWKSSRIPSARATDCTPVVPDFLLEPRGGAISPNNTAGDGRLGAQRTSDQSPIARAKSRVQRGGRKLGDEVIKCCRIELDARGALTDAPTRSETGAC